MKKAIKWLGIIMLAVIAGFTVISCINSGNSDGSGKTRVLEGEKYVIITPQDYAKKIKAGDIGVNEKFVMDGLVMGITDDTLMMQKAGLTNIFTLDNSIELNMGTKIRIYFEISMVNTLLISASQATVVKLEKL